MGEIWIGDRNLEVISLLIIFKAMSLPNGPTSSCPRTTETRGSRRIGEPHKRDRKGAAKGQKKTRRC
jgi:hypothetical protein